MRIGTASNPNPAMTPTLSNPGSQTTPLGSGASLQLAASRPQW